MPSAQPQGLGERIGKAFVDAYEFFAEDNIWPRERVAALVAQLMDRDKTILRKQKVVEGIAHGVREDLDELANKNKADKALYKKYVKEVDFQNYLTSPDGLKKRLHAAGDPAGPLAGHG
jgi:hypothetical protein